MTDDEKERFKSAVNGDLLWIWIGQLLGTCVHGQDRMIVLNTVASAQGDMRKTKTAVNVPVPYIYTHMLSLLVHVNNLLCAVRFGLSLAMTLSDLILEYNMSMPWHVAPPRQHGKKGSSSLLFQIVISFCSYMIAPVMYQGFLMIGLGLSKPFATTFHTTRIPVDALLKKLKQDIEDANQLSRDPPSRFSTRKVSATSKK